MKKIMSRDYYQKHSMPYLNTYADVLYNKGKIYITHIYKSIQAVNISV